MNRGSAVGNARGNGWMSEGSEFKSRRGKEFSPLHIAQIGSGIHPTSYQVGTGGSFPGVKRQGREADNSHLTSAEVKKTWA
jgi:hypothetical protein